ncbi:MAG: serine hydrolase domain-containing protein [Candidatus Nanopelagicales bacterium]
MDRTASRFRKGLIGGSALILAAVVTGCGSSSTSDSSSSSPTPLPNDAAIRNSMTELMAGDGPPGVIAVIQNGDQRYEVAEGKANVSSGAAMSGDSSIRIASVSKAYNGAIVLSLASKGELALSDTVGQLLPTAPKAWGKATVAQVLQHTSGIPDYIKSPRFIKEFVADPQMQRTPEQLMGYVSDKPLGFPPGSKYQYSDTDNIVAGLIAEQVTGKSYNDLLKEIVTSPLDVPVTSLPDTLAIPEPRINGYAPADPAETSASPSGPEDVTEVLNPQLAWASGGMISTPNELNTFMRSYASGKLFSDAIRAQQLQFVPGGGGPPGPGVNSSGLSIYQYKTKCGTFYGHTGNMPGYTIFAASTPDGTRSVVVLANSQVTDASNPAKYQQLVAVWNEALCAAKGSTSTPAPSASATATP